MPRVKSEPQDIIDNVKPVLVPSRVKMTDGRWGTIVGVTPGIARGGILIQDKMRYGVIIDGVTINGVTTSVWLTYKCFDFSEQEQEEPAKPVAVKKKAAVKKGVRNA